MEYTEFRDTVYIGLKQHPSGLTWQELKTSLDLPYQRPCPEWVKRLEVDLDLKRNEKKGNALIWRLSNV